MRDSSIAQFLAFALLGDIAGYVPSPLEPFQAAAPEESSVFLSTKLLKYLTSIVAAIIYYYSFINLITYKPVQYAFDAA